MAGKMERTPSLLHDIRWGLLSILIGIVPSGLHYLYDASRIYTPVNTEAPVAPSTIRTEFLVNHPGLYGINYEIDRRFTVGDMECLLGVGVAVLKGECDIPYQPALVSWAVRQRSAG